MAYSKSSITFNGVSNQILVPFGYIRKADIYVGIGEEAPFSPLYNGTELTWLSSGIAVLPGAVLAAGTKGVVYRSTQMIDAAVLQSANYDHAAINTAFLRQLYLIQEALDNPQGPKGDPGADGADGADGAPGADGIDGSKWLSGSGAPAAGLGNVDEYYIRTDNGDVYKKTDATTWTVIMNIKGPSGAGTGDMLASVYDTNGDGKVNAAAAADTVPWSGVSGKPGTFTPSAHNHPTSEVTGLDAALAAKADGAATTAALAAKADSSAMTSALAAKADASAVSSALAGKADVAAAVPTGGTTGQVLKKNSNANNDVGWGDAGGLWKVVDDVTLGGAAARITTSASLSGYKAFRVRLLWATPVTNNVHLVLTFSTDNGGSYSPTMSSGVAVSMDVSPSGDSTTAGQVTGTGTGPVTNNDITGGASGEAVITQKDPGTGRFQVQGHFHAHGVKAYAYRASSASAYAALTNIAFAFSAGNVAAGARMIVEGLV